MSGHTRKYLTRLLLVEAPIVGFSVAVFSGLVMYFAEKLPQWEESEGELKYYIASFASGALLHLLFEFTQVNSYYLKNSAAAMHSKWLKSKAK